MDPILVRPGTRGRGTCCCQAPWCAPAGRRQRFPPGSSAKGAEKSPVVSWAIQDLLTCDICWWEALKASAGENDTSRLRDIRGGNAESSGPASAARFGTSR